METLCIYLSLFKTLPSVYNFFRLNQLLQMYFDSFSFNRALYDRLNALTLSGNSI